MSSSFIDLNINNAEQFLESVSEASPNTKLYITMGRVNSWADDNLPPNANSSIATVYEVWDAMIGGKRIVGSDMQTAIPRYNWKTDTVYTAYDHMNDALFDANSRLYVLTSAYNVYKCISNNYGSNSTVEPTSVNPASVTTTSDGYIWKYMYTISDSDQIKFTTDNFIPVRTLTQNDGSPQWGVQSQAVSGGIYSVLVTNGGANYSNASNLIVTITGDGTGAAAIATINSTSQTVNNVIMINPGSDYTYASAIIGGGGATSGANARVIISPPGGHGSNPLYELGGKYVVINGRFKYDESGVLPVTNDFRQISLLKDPYLYGQSNVAVTAAFLQALSITAVGIGDFKQDEYLYQGPSLAASTFSGRVVSWDSATSKALLINIRGTPTAAQSLIGSESATVRIISSVTNEALKKYSGRILYVDNFVPITRASDQIEDFKIVVQF